MIIQIANIASGAALAAKAQIALQPDTRKTIGLVEFVLGVLAFLNRAGLPMPIPLFGASYPQAIIAILIGLLLAETYFDQYPTAHQAISTIKPFELWIGLAGIVIGLYSLL